MEIEITSLSKNYGKIEALKNVNIRISGNGLVTFLGANGAGKTTLFKILTSIIRPTAGAIRVNGIDVDSEPKKVLSMIGSLVEQPEFYPYLTGNELLEFTGKSRGVERRSLEEEIERVSNVTGISSYLNRKSGEYSRGMKQRLGVAVALIGDPKILILDEPTFGMDPRGMLETRVALKSLKKEEDRLIIMSTHLLDEARELSDRTIVLRNGSIKYDSSGLGDSTHIRVTGKINLSYPFRSGRVIESGEGYAIFEIPQKDRVPDFNRELLSSNSEVIYINPSDNLEREFLTD